MARTGGSGRVFTTNLTSGATRYHIEYSDGFGRPKRQSLPHVTSEAEARLELAKHVAKREEERLYGVRRPSADRVLLDPLLADYLTSASLRLKRYNFSHMSADLRRTVTDLGSPEFVGQITLARMRQLQADLKTAGRSHRTINKKTAAIKTLLKWAEDNDLINSSPVAGLKPLPADPVKTKRAFTIEELHRFLEAAQEYDRQDSRGSRPKAPVFLTLLGLAETGCRYGELRQLRWTDVDWEKGIINIRSSTAKNKSARWVPISETLAQHLRTTGRTDGILFPHWEQVGRFRSPKAWPKDAKSLGSAFDKILAICGLPKADDEGHILSVHSLRHTFCTRLVASGMSLKHAQTMTGHKTLEVLLSIYTHLGMDDVLSSYSKLVAPLAPLFRPTTPDTVLTHGN